MDNENLQTIAEIGKISPGAKFVFINTLTLMFHYVKEIGDSSIEYWLKNNEDLVLMANFEPVLRLSIQVSLKT